MRFVGMSLGAIGAGTGRVFPKSIIGVVFCGIGALLWASGIIPFRYGLRRIRTPEGSRFFGFSMFGTAMVALTFSVAWGRAGWVSLSGMPDRYVVLSMPGLCAVYFAWLLYGPRTVRDRLANAFAAAALVALPFNVNQGLVVLNWYVAETRAFDHDLVDGLSWRELADKHWQFLFPFSGGRDTLIDYARMLHDAKIGPFGRAAP
jgi:hypothetical protein